MSRFCMPYNGDLKLIDIVIGEYTNHVSSFYGSMGRDLFGGGRALSESQNQTVGSLSKTISRLDKHGIEFNYVINNTNMMNREFSPDYQKAYSDFLKTLQSAGVRTVTLSNLELIRLTKEQMPDWKISASINLKTRTPEEVQFLLSLGCKEMTLHYNVLKDITALKQIRSETNIDLKLIPNDIYIMECPWQKGHSRMQSAHGRAKDFETPYFSYYRNKCVNLRHMRPEEILKAMWIPPDQLWRYEAIGYDYFKLLDRLATTEWNIRTLNTYIQAKPRNDLETVLGTYGAIATKQSPMAIGGDERPYPQEKLEVIPSIMSKKMVNAFSYFFDVNHPAQCDECQACFKAAATSVKFLDNAHKRAIENNREWQAQITRPSFIERLEGFHRRVQYD